MIWATVAASASISNTNRPNTSDTDKNAPPQDDTLLLLEEYKILFNSSTGKQGSAQFNDEGNTFLRESFRDEGAELQQAIGPELIFTPS